MAKLPSIAFALTLAVVGQVVSWGFAPRAVAIEVGADVAAEALERGEIMPLSEILTILGEEHSGRVLDIRLEDGGRGLQGWIYNVRLLKDDGNILLLRLDAATSSILAVSGE